MKAEEKFLEKYIIKEETEDEENKNKVPPIDFFTENLLEIAIDNSGSTAGKVLRLTKKLVEDILKDFEFASRIKNKIIAWNHRVNIQSLDSIKSSGGTEPSLIFQYLDKEPHNLFITTDGEIDQNEVNNVRSYIKSYPDLRNIIAFVINCYIEKPSKIDVSVFYPFLEHAQKMGGNFLLFLLREDKIYLLLKA